MSEENKKEEKLSSDQNLKLNLEYVRQRTIQ